MELVGTLKTTELFLYFWRFFQDYEKSLNSFWTGAFFPGEELKDLSFDLLPSHFYSSGEFPSSGLVTNLAEHFGENLKNHENHAFQAALAPETRFFR